MVSAGDYAYKGLELNSELYTSNSTFTVSFNGVCVSEFSNKCVFHKSVCVFIWNHYSYCLNNNNNNNNNNNKWVELFIYVLSR